LPKSAQDLARLLADAVRNDGDVFGVLQELIRVSPYPWPSKMTAAKVYRTKDFVLVGEQTVQFTIERHHEERWAAIQTWCIDTRTGKHTCSESEPSANVDRKDK
jgi:hypothetical protein